MKDLNANRLASALRKECKIPGNVHNQQHEVPIAKITH
jgi:hypothetical protein